MYYMLECLDPADGFMALLDYRSDDPRRSWTRGKPFKNLPSLPVKASLKMRENSKLIEMWAWPVPLMTKRLHDVLLKAGVANLEVFPAELEDPASGAVRSNYVAFNIVGVIAAANLAESNYDAPDAPLVSVDFDSLSIDSEKANSALMFRLAESTNGIVVHESVKAAIEAAGIDTLNFVRPEDWTS